MTLERWGLRWKGHDHAVCEPMVDGYWTPWHIAAAMLREVAAERDSLREKVGKFGRDHTKLADISDAAEAERDRLAAMVEKLRGYARHRQGCDLVRWDLDCTCGLSEVLKESENG